jgi:hypothetical protein
MWPLWSFIACLCPWFGWPYKERRSRICFSSPWFCWIDLVSHYMFILSWIPWHCMVTFSQIWLITALPLFMDGAHPVWSEKKCHPIYTKILYGEILFVYQGFVSNIHSSASPLEMASDLKFSRRVHWLVSYKFAARLTQNLFPFQILIQVRFP